MVVGLLLVFNHQGTYRWTGSAPEWIYPIKLSKCFYIACQDIGGGGRIPRIFMIGTV